MPRLTKGGNSERDKLAQAQAERKLRRQWETDEDRIQRRNDELLAETETSNKIRRARQGVPAANSFEPAAASENFKPKLGRNTSAAGPGGKRNNRRKSRKQKKSRKSRKSRKVRKSHKRNCRH